MTEFLVFIDILAWYMLSLFVRLSVCLSQAGTVLKTVRTINAVR